jgi:hypothetical protein
LTCAGDVKKWQAVRSRKYAMWSPDGKYLPNATPVIGRFTAETFLIEV